MAEPLAGGVGGKVGVDGTGSVGGVDAVDDGEPGGPLRPTPTGWSLAVSSVAVLVLAYAFGYGMLASLGLAGLAVLAAAVPVVSKHAPVEVSRQVFPVRVARGETAVALLTIRNNSTRRHQRITARERIGDRVIPVRVGMLPASGAVEARCQLPTDRRGNIEIGPLSWDRVDPLGLLGRGATLPGTAMLHVHPAVHLFPLGAAARMAHGDKARTDLAPEGSITFHTLREYVPGDDLRRIHWRASAHRGELMVRQNIDVTPPRSTVLLVTDPDCYADPDDFEHAVDVAASAAVNGLREGQAVALWTTSGLRLLGNGAPDDVSVFLDQLAGVALVEPDSGTGTGIVATVSRLEHGETGGTLVVAGGHPDADGISALHRVAGRFGLAVLLRAGRSRASTRGTTQDSSTGSSGVRPGALTVVDGPDAGELCGMWLRLAPSLTRSGAR
jgi:uncharacterized protein (DUF58 family)